MRRARAEGELLVEVTRRVRARRRRRLVVGLSTLVGVALAGVLWIPARLLPEPNLSPRGSATVLLPKRQVLPDGSLVDLKGEAQIYVDYSGANRRVVLLQGEAHFEVVKNSRPFIVEAAGINVRAVGTAFSVQLGSEKVEVLVTEGQVRVAPIQRVAAPATGTGPLVSWEARARSDLNEPILRAGHRGIVHLNSTPTQIDALSSTDVSARMAWRVPSLEFSRTPLTAVVELMNRHATGQNRARFVIESPDLREVKLSGFLRTDNSEGLVRLLEKDFGAKAERVGQTITLRKAD